MVSAVETVFLGFVQGLTEWLPVSSSGHLVISEVFVSWEPPLIFYILLHLATLVVIAVFFRRRILEVLQALLKGDYNSETGRMGIYVIVGSIPTAIIGFVLQDLFESLFNNLFVVGLSLIITGLLLYISRFREGKRSINLLDSIIIGIVQGLAIIPGISRSGATISIGLLRGVDREEAFTFSFLLSLPAVIGAFFQESSSLSLYLGGEDLIAVALGIATAVIVGYLSLKLLFTLVKKKKFHWFALYCWVIGTLVIVLRLL